jgi:hypothetical protein
MNNRKKELLNTLLNLNKLRRQIEVARYARGMTDNNNQYRIMNNRMRGLIRQTHPLEERVFVLSIGMSPGSIERVKRLRHVVAVQRRTRKTIQKRRQNIARARTLMRRALVIGAHHALTPAQLMRHTMTPAQLVRIRRASTVVPRRAHGTRSSTLLTRQLMN